MSIRFGRRAASPQLPSYTQTKYPTHLTSSEHSSSTEVKIPQTRARGDGLSDVPLTSLSIGHGSAGIGHPKDAAVPWANQEGPQQLIVAPSFCEGGTRFGVRLRRNPKRQPQLRLCLPFEGSDRQRGIVDCSFPLEPQKKGQRASNKAHSQRTPPF